MVSQSTAYQPDPAVLTDAAVRRMWNVYPGYSAEQFTYSDL
jgi:hypothetical protein